MNKEFIKTAALIARDMSYFVFMVGIYDSVAGEARDGMLVTVAAICMMLYMFASIWRFENDNQ